jgi:hypothetical protein
LPSLRHTATPPVGPAKARSVSTAASRHTRVIERLCFVLEETRMRYDAVLRESRIDVATPAAPIHSRDE